MPPRTHLGTLKTHIINACSVALHRADINCILMQIKNASHCNRRFTAHRNCTFKTQFLGLFVPFNTLYLNAFLNLQVASRSSSPPFSSWSTLQTRFSPARQMQTPSTRYRYQKEENSFFGSNAFQGNRLHVIQILNRRQTTGCSKVVDTCDLKSLRYKNQNFVFACQYWKEEVSSFVWYATF
jgi:hypothetical protein